MTTFSKVTKPKAVVYIAGPFRAPTPYQVELNVRRAEALALSVWQSGYVALCPHLNSRLFDREAPDHVWLDGDLELMSRCDAVLLTPDWMHSKGATVERNRAIELEIPVFESLEDLKRGRFAE